VYNIITQVNPFAALAGGCHLPGATITSLDCSLLQPMAVTCGTDACIRVWDFERRYCTVAKHFPDEEVLCVSMHPSGLHIAAGFSDKVRRPSQAACCGAPEPRRVAPADIAKSATSPALR
jgi:WD40 repeat protein